MIPYDRPLSPIHDRSSSYPTLRKQEHMVEGGRRGQKGPTCGYPGAIFLSFSQSFNKKLFYTYEHMNQVGAGTLKEYSRGGRGRNVQTVTMSPECCHQDISAFHNVFLLLHTIFFYPTYIVSTIFACDKLITSCCCVWFEVNLMQKPCPCPS